VVAQVVNSMDGDSARGDYAGLMEVVHTLLQWTTRFGVGGSEAAAMVSEAADL
jgi:hypothetical protein